MQVWSLGWEDPPEKKMATCSSTLAWAIPQRSLVGCSPRGHRESDTTERLHKCHARELSTPPRPRHVWPPPDAQGWKWCWVATPMRTACPDALWGRAREGRQAACALGAAVPKLCLWALQWISTTGYLKFLKHDTQHLSGPCTNYQVKVVYSFHISLCYSHFDDLISL